MNQERARAAGHEGFGRTYEGRDVLVLGGTGFIGRWLVERLGRAGARVHLGARDVNAAEVLLREQGLTGRVLRMDAGEPETLRNSISGLRPSVTFNLAGYGVAAGERDVAESLRVNGAFVRALCDVLGDVAEDGWPGAALVHVGSQLEYGPIGGNLAEDAEEAPDTVYGRSKLEGTRAVRAAAATGLRGVTARLFNVYGAGEPEGRLLPSLVRAAAERRPIDLTAGLQALDFVYVEDVAEGLMRIGAVLSPPGAVVNLATGELTKVRDFAMTAAAALDMPRELLRFGALPTRSTEMRYDPVDTGRLRELTGWIPATTVPQGITRSLLRMAHASR